MTITFRRLEDADLPMLHEWLNDPGVVEWWEGQDVSWDGVVEHYAPANAGPREQWLALLDGRPVGWLQCYRALDHLDETELWWDHGVDEAAAGIDYLVADPATRGQGIGPRMIRAFSDEVVLGLHPTWTQVCAGPFAANVGSCRALEKAGFRLVAMIDDDEGTCQLMALDR